MSCWMDAGALRMIETCEEARKARRILCSACRERLRRGLAWRCFDAQYPLPLQFWPATYTHFSFSPRSCTEMERHENLDLEPENPQPGQPSREVLLTMHLLQELQRRGGIPDDSSRGGIPEDSTSPTSRDDEQFNAALAQFIQQTTRCIADLRARVQQLEQEVASIARIVSALVPE